MIFDSWLRLMPQLNGLCQLVKPFGWILERKKDPNPKQLKVARRENSMHTKTLETIKRHVAALPIQTGRSRCWSSNGSGVSLRSVGIGLGAWGLYAAAGGVTRDGWRMQNLEEIRLNVLTKMRFHGTTWVKATIPWNHLGKSTGWNRLQHRVKIGYSTGAICIIRTCI
jgi:hypothetical protein